MCPTRRNYSRSFGKPTEFCRARGRGVVVGYTHELRQPRFPLAIDLHTKAKGQSVGQGERRVRPFRRDRGNWRRTFPPPHVGRADEEILLRPGLLSINAFPASLGDTLLPFPLFPPSPFRRARAAEEKTTGVKRKVFITRSEERLGFGKR